MDETSFNFNENDMMLAIAAATAASVPVDTMANTDTDIKDFSKLLLTSSSQYDLNESERLKSLEDEQELLNGSLMALTTHFAQVQFRLRQIVNAPNEYKEDLLKELEEFASRGIPDLNQKHVDTVDAAVYHEHIIDEQRKKQKKLIEELKVQLQDLESYAYQSGDLEMPTSVVMEKHKVIIDELKEKMHLPIDNINKLSNEDIKKVVDHAISQIVNPVKVKEQLVGQLKTQISDLERFIDFLQGEATSPGPYVAKNKGNCSCSSNGEFSFNEPEHGGSNKTNKNSTQNNPIGSTENRSNQYHKTIDMLKKVLAIIEIFAVTQLNCGTKTFEKNTLKKTSANHWGDLRANLELAINVVIGESKKVESNKSIIMDSDCDSDEFNNNDKTCSSELADAVRKSLFTALRDLLQHGLVEVNYTRSLVPVFTCFPIRAKETFNELHAWDLFLKYYELKHGKEFTDSPARKLSQSFNLNVVGGRAITIKQSFLSTIETVLNLHKTYKHNNKDAHLKTFICIALNEKRLVLYLKQLLKTSVLIENNYQHWSYVKSTGFDDALKSLDQLKSINFNLPIDQSVKYSNKIKDLFE